MDFKKKQTRLVVGLAPHPVFAPMSATIGMFPMPTAPMP